MVLWHLQNKHTHTERSHNERASENCLILTTERKKKKKRQQVLLSYLAPCGE